MMKSWLSFTKLRFQVPKFRLLVLAVQTEKIVIFFFNLILLSDLAADLLCAELLVLSLLINGPEINLLVRSRSFPARSCSFLAPSLLVLKLLVACSFPPMCIQHSTQTTSPQPFIRPRPSDGNPMTVGVGSLLQQTGYSFMLPETIAGALWKSLAQFGAIPMGANAWETLRILEGRPAVGKELTNDYNVLEAGLWKTISTTKGCYIGQETITRLITYDGVKQHLWGLRLEGPATQGSVITVDDKKVGKLTSYAQCSSGNHVGLGYVRRQVGLANQAVKVGDVEGILAEVPFLSRSLPEDMSLGIVRSST